MESERECLKRIKDINERWLKKAPPKTNIQKRNDFKHGSGKTWEDKKK